MASTLNNHIKRRWHDQHPTWNQSVTMLEMLPEDVLSIVADGVVMLGEADYKTEELFNSLKSMGSEKVLALYKAKKKQRKHDNIKNYQKAMQSMYILTDEDRTFMAHQVIQLIQHVGQYFQLCRQYNQVPREEEIRTLTRMYATDRAEGVDVFFETFEENFKMFATKQEAVIQTENNGDLYIVEDED